MVFLLGFIVVCVAVCCFANNNAFTETPGESPIASDILQGRLNYNRCDQQDVELYQLSIPRESSLHRILQESGHRRSELHSVDLLEGIPETSENSV